MRAAKLSRKIHKWIALVVGVQFILWAISGFYMVVVDIDTIHGDMLVKNMATPLAERNSRISSISDLPTRYPGAHKITEKNLMQAAVYLVEDSLGVQLLDAATAEPLPALNREQAVEVARYHYNGDAEIGAVDFIDDQAPGEIRFSALPQWRVNFDDAWGSSFYIDPQTGRLTTRRHTLWRVFDFMWMLHIMDFDERDDVNNLLLRGFSILGVVLGLSGLWLLFYSFRRSGTVRSGARVFFHKLHKWLSLVLGAQVLVWLLTGALISLLDSQTVGGRLTRQPPAQPIPLAQYGSLVPLEELSILSDTLRTVELTSLLAQPVYRLTEADSRQLFDARSGQAQVIDRELVERIANASYRGEGLLQAGEKLAQGSEEMRGVSGPMWRLDYDDPLATRVYVSAEDGRVLAHRNDQWQLFDFLLMLHFMDYGRDDHFNNPQIIVFGFATLWLALSGLILLFYSFSRRDFRL